MPHSCAHLLPRVGTGVSVLMDGHWLDGTVIEADHAFGEFLVDFDEEHEVSSWVGVSEVWRKLRPDIEADPIFDSEPCIPPPAPPAPSAAPPPPPTQAAPTQLPPPAPLQPHQAEHDNLVAQANSTWKPPPPPPPPDRQHPSHAAPVHGSRPSLARPHQPDPETAEEPGQVWNALLHEFGQLHESTVESDGYGAESANQTRGRFERLHASMSTGSGK